jgi:hypothetical protein
VASWERTHVILTLQIGQQRLTYCIIHLSEVKWLPFVCSPNSPQHRYGQVHLSLP